MTPCDHIDPQETDTWSMLSNSDILTFYNQELHEVKKSLKITPLYSIRIFAFCGASEALSILKASYYSFKEECTSSKFTNEWNEVLPVLTDCLYNLTASMRHGTNMSVKVTCLDDFFFAWDFG